MDIIVHTKTHCTWCDMAKSWLTENGFEYETILHDDNDERQEFYESCDQDVRSVPQIFIQLQENEPPIRIGGYQDLIKSEFFYSSKIKFDSDF